MTVALVKGAALLLAAMIVLAFLADGPATDTELRRAAQTRPRENLRSLLQRLEREGLVVAIPGASPAGRPHRLRRWALAWRHQRSRREARLSASLGE